MGYYGLGPGSTIPDKLSTLQQLLRRLPLESALAALEVLEKITRNVVHSPAEQKFRTLKMSNAKLAPMLCIPSLQDIMREMGWEIDAESIILPSSVRLDFQEHVVKIIEVKDYYKKEIEKAKKLERIAADPAKAEVQRQMDVDRREREAAAALSAGKPVAVPATATAAMPPVQLPAARTVAAAAPPPPVYTAAPTGAPSAQDQMAQLRAEQQQKYAAAPPREPPAASVSAGPSVGPAPVPGRRWYQCFGGGSGS